MASLVTTTHNASNTTEINFIVSPIYLPVCRGRGSPRSNSPSNPRGCIHRAAWSPLQRFVHQWWSGVGGGLPGDLGQASGGGGEGGDCGRGLHAEGPGSDGGRGAGGHEGRAAGSVSTEQGSHTLTLLLPRILHKYPGQDNFTVAYSNSDNASFLNGIAFWEDGRGVAFGDPIGE